MRYELSLGHAEFGIETFCVVLPVVG